MWGTGRATIRPTWAHHPGVAGGDTPIGGWEGDTLCAGEGKGGMATLAGRKSSLACGWGSSFKAGGGDRGRVQGSHDCVSTIAHSRQAAGMGRTILEALKDKPGKGPAAGQRPRICGLQALEKQPKAPIPFAGLHRPWQRGYNGNAHGLLRYSYPRGCNFLGVPQAGLGRVLNLASHRPRKRPRLVHALRGLFQGCYTCLTIYPRVPVPKNAAGSKPLPMGLPPSAPTFSPAGTGRSAPRPPTRGAGARLHGAKGAVWRHRRPPYP